nr:hypothetical protein [Tanacetum cinerariifolium]
MKDLTVTLHHDGVFVPNPLKLVVSPTKRLYYVIPRTTLTRGIREITSDADMVDFVKVGFENGFKVDFYHEYNDYDVMAYTTNDNLFPDEDDNLGDDEGVVETVLQGNYIKTKENHIPPLSGHVEEVDPQEADMDPKSGGNSLPVYCSRDVDMGRCDGRRVIRKKRNNRNIKLMEKVLCQPIKVWKCEKSFQIKSLYSDHRCIINYNVGLLETFKWIARHYVNEIVMNPSLTYRFMREDVREKFMIDEYKKAVLESNPGSTCHLDVDFNNDGKPVFQRMYVCFKGVKDGWIAGCRKVIRIDGCFITHMCKGEILTVMGGDGNNQLYPIAWAVVDVENKNNWCWFLLLLADNLDLQEGLGVTIISDSHKVLIEAVRTWLPQAEHRHFTRHIYANFKRRWSGLIYKRLFWGAAASTIEQDFTRYMEQIRQLDPEAYRYLMEREPERWSKAYFQTGRSCASFKNEISKSFTSMSTHHILGIIDVVKVRKRDEAYGFNLMDRTCDCRLWSLSGVPCVHAVATFLHFKLNLDDGVSSWVGRLITCQNCQKTDHNKASCKDPKAPKPALMKPLRAPTICRSGAKGGSGANDGSGANGRVFAKGGVSKGGALKGASGAKGC